MLASACSLTTSVDEAVGTRAACLRDGRADGRHVTGLEAASAAVGGRRRDRARRSRLGFPVTDAFELSPCSDVAVSPSPTRITSPRRPRFDAGGGRDAREPRRDTCARHGLRGGVQAADPATSSRRPESPRRHSAHRAPRGPVTRDIDPLPPSWPKSGHRLHVAADRNDPAGAGVKKKVATGSVNPSGAPKGGLCESERWVLAMQIGSVPSPARSKSNAARARAARARPRPQRRRASRSPRNRFIEAVEEAAASG